MKTRDNLITWKNGGYVLPRLQHFRALVCVWIFFVSVLVVTSFFLFPVPAPSLQLSHAQVGEKVPDSLYSYFVRFIAGIWGSHDPRHWGAALTAFCNTTMKTTLAGGTGIIPYIAKQEKTPLIQMNMTHLKSPIRITPTFGADYGNSRSRPICHMISN